MQKPSSEAITLTPREIFARNLRRYRRMREVSQEDLANLAGMSRSYVSGVERAERNISIDNMGKLAEALNVRLTALVDETLFDSVENR